MASLPFTLEAFPGPGPSPPLCVLLQTAHFLSPTLSFPDRVHEGLLPKKKPRLSFRNSLRPSPEQGDKVGRRGGDTPPWRHSSLESMDRHLFSQERPRGREGVSKGGLSRHEENQTLTWSRPRKGVCNPQAPWRRSTIPDVGGLLGLLLLP